MASAAASMQNRRSPQFNYPIRLSDAASGVWFQDSGHSGVPAAEIFSTFLKARWRMR